MIRPFAPLATLFVFVVGCAASPARFETSEAPPPDESKDRPPLAAYLGQIRSPADSTLRMQRTTDRFLLALQNRASDQLETLLTPDATVREQGSGSKNPALPLLLDLASSWSDLNQDASGILAPSPSPFGPARVIEIQNLGSEVWATIEVAGPPRVEGLWKIRIANSQDLPQVEEVILPKFQ